MEKIIVTEEIIWLAEKRIEEIPLLKGSILGEPAKVIGEIGEVLFENFIKANGLTVRKEKDEVARYNHDFVVDEKFKIEVKTKDRNGPPKPYYDCSVNDSSLKNQKPDFFFFITLVREKGVIIEGYLLGAINLPNLLTKGEAWEKGEVDARNGKVVSHSCVNIEIKDLVSNDEFINILKGE